jgi:hypothetical protein
MAKQMGSSRRGPDDIERAVGGPGGSAQGEASPSVADDDELYATGELDDQDTEPLLADGELVGSWSGDAAEEDRTLLAGDESVGPWSEDDEIAFTASDEDDGDQVDDDAPRGWPPEPGPSSGRR